MTYLNRIGVITLVAVLAVFGAFGQTPTQINLLAGPSFDGHKVGGTVGASYPFSLTTAGGVAADLTFRAKTLPQTTIRGFFEWQPTSVQIGALKLPVIFTQDVGAAFAASDPAGTIEKTGTLVNSVLSNVGTNVGYLAATGIRTEFPIFAGLVLQPRARITKGSLNDAGWAIGVTLAAKVTVSK